MNKFEATIEMTTGPYVGTEVKFFCSGTVEEIYSFIFRVQSSIYSGSYLKSLIPVPLFPETSLPKRPHQLFIPFLEQN